MIYPSRCVVRHVLEGNLLLPVSAIFKGAPGCLRGRSPCVHRRLSGLD